MNIDRIGIADLKNNLSKYLNQQQPIAVMKHGKIVGFYLPVERDNSYEVEFSLQRIESKLKSLRKNNYE